LYVQYRATEKPHPKKTAFFKIIFLICQIREN
jgi:hypothetical protein